VKSENRNVLKHPLFTIDNSHLTIHNSHLTFLYSWFWLNHPLWISRSWFFRGGFILAGCLLDDVK